MNSVRYDSPTFAGFSVSAAWGEDDIWDVAARYAGEWNGIKVAVAAAYGELTAPDTCTVDTPSTGNCNLTGFQGSNASFLPAASPGGFRSAVQPVLPDRCLCRARSDGPVPLRCLRQARHA